MVVTMTDVAIHNASDGRIGFEPVRDVAQAWFRKHYPGRDGSVWSDHAQAENLAMLLAAHGFAMRPVRGGGDFSMKSARGGNDEADNNDAAVLRARRHCNGAGHRLSDFTNADDGTVTLGATPDTDSVMVFRGYDSMMEVSRLLRAKANWALILPLFSCLAPSGSKAIVNSAPGYNAVAIKVVDGSDAGCAGVVSLSQLKQETGD
jgi:hypothetical protein